MCLTPIRGLLASLPTPRMPGGAVDRKALERNAEFALAHGARGVVACGGTGEYFDLSPRQRREIVECLLPVVRGRALLIAGVGSGSAKESVQLGRHALHAGPDAVLLPSPHFYRYEDPDLLQFFHQTAQAIAGPVLLYNLASFVSPISEFVAIELLQTAPYIVGVKDSSGSLVLLRHLKRQRGSSCARIQGHDSVLAQSLRESLLDAAISGPAAVVPEAPAALFETVGHAETFDRIASLYRELLDQMKRYPYPWAVKWIAEWRGLGAARLPFALAHQRRRSKERFRVCFEGWLGRLVAHLEEIRKA